MKHNCWLVGLLLFAQGGASLALAAPALRAPELIPSEPTLAPPERVDPVITPLPARAAFQLPAEHHTWGKFAPGAWRRLRSTSETFSPTGEVLGRTVTTRTQRLIEVTPATYTLEESSEVSVGGAQLPGPTQRITLGLLVDQPQSAAASIQELEMGKVRIAGSDIPCRRVEVNWLAANQPRRDVLWYAAGKAPFVLRRERFGATGETAAEEIWRARRLELPVALGDRMVPGWQWECDAQNASGTTHRVASWSLEVPGGLVHESNVERDAAGNRLRWTVTELIDSGLGGSGEANTPAEVTKPKPPEVQEAPRPRLRIFRRRFGE